MEEVYDFHWTQSFTNKRLELILLITEQCNFRCLYCYEDFKLGKILPSVINGVKNLISERISEIEELSLSFFGGEPLMNKKDIIELSIWVLKLCKIKGVKFYGGISTNGYSLDSEVFSKLIESGVANFQITLDGDKEGHDKLRPTVNGKPTFDKIFSNLKMIAHSNHEFKCTIRFNVSDSNLDSVERFILNDSIFFENDFRFRFHFHPIFGVEQLRLNRENELDCLKEKAVKKGLLFNINSGQSGSCYASKANSFVIRADGRIQKCTVALESDINNIGKIKEDGTMEINNEKLKKWMFAENKSCPVQSLKLEKLIVPYENAGKYI